MIKTVLFDLDDTILDFKKAESIAIRKALSEMNIKPTDSIAEIYSEINKSQWLLLEQQRITRSELLTRRFDLLFEKLGVKRSGKQMQTIYERFLAEEHVFIPDANEVLNVLSKEFSMYIVSNGSAFVQENRIKSSGISKYFKNIFISERIGFNKPHKAFFDKCFSSIELLDRSNTIIIGDSLTSDIKGGNNAGILTCWYNPSKKSNNSDAVVDYEISSLTELPALLKQN